MIFIIKGFQTIVFIFIAISIMFRPICPPAFFRCLSNSGTFKELRTTSFIDPWWSPVLIPLAKIHFYVNNQIYSKQFSLA